MSKNKWFSIRKITIISDLITNERKRIEELLIKKKEYDLYMKTYLENLDIKGVKKPNATEYDVLVKLAKRIRFNTSEIIINTGLIEMIAEDLEITTRSVNMAIDNLAEKDIIISYSKGYYKLNPVYYWVGNEDERSKELLKIDEEILAIKNREKEDENRRAFQESKLNS